MHPVGFIVVLDNNPLPFVVVEILIHSGVEFWRAGVGGTFLKPGAENCRRKCRLPAWIVPLLSAGRYSKSMSTVRRLRIVPSGITGKNIHKKGYIFPVVYS